MCNPGNYNRRNRAKKRRDQPGGYYGSGAVSALIAGISTLIQLISFKYTIGSGLPVIIGVSFAYLASLQGLQEQFDLQPVWASPGWLLAAILVGIFIKRLRFLFPPMVTGTVVFVIGITLYPTAINYMAGEAGAKITAISAELDDRACDAGDCHDPESFRKGAVVPIFHITWNPGRLRHGHVSWND
ncbi:MAG: solute carrier family 23 protein [[Clostridium] scindens]